MKKKETAKVKRTGDAGFFVGREVIEREIENRRLDSFALLFEANMTCAAVSIIDNVLYVATNSTHATCKVDDQLGIQFLQKILNYFSKLQRSGQTDSGMELHLLKYIFVSTWQSTYKASNPLSSNISEESLDKIINYLIKNKASVWRSKNLEFFVDFLNSSKAEIYRIGRTEKNKKEYDIISDELVDIQKVFSFISPFVRHFKKVKSLLQNKDSKISDFRILAVGKTGDHAEIRLIGYLLDSGIIKKLISLKTKVKLYIGISKLCCCYCIKTVEVMNNSIKTVNGKNFFELQYPENEIIHEVEVPEHVVIIAERDQLSESLKIETAGTHGLSTNWEAPAYCKGMTYVDRGGKDEDSPSFMYSVATGTWQEIEFQSLETDQEFLEIIKTNFNSGIENLKDVLESLKQKKSTNMDDSIRQFFRQKVSMLPERSSSSEEQNPSGMEIPYGLIQNLGVYTAHNVKDSHHDDQPTGENVKRLKSDPDHKQEFDGGM